MLLAMSQTECQLFLSKPYVGVISVARRTRAPLCVPIWYTYAPGGEVGIWTGRRSAKARLLARFGRFSLCVQNEKPPYSFVSVEGPVSSVKPVDYERHLRPIVYRYLGEEAGAKYLNEYGGPNAVKDDVWILMTPELWYSKNYSKE